MNRNKELSSYKVATLENMTPGEKKPDTKGHVEYVSTYINIQNIGTKDQDCAGLGERTG